MPSKPLANVVKAAQLERVPPRWLKEEANAGRVPHLRIGKRLLFNVDAVRRCLADRASREGISARS